MADAGANRDDWRDGRDGRRAGGDGRRAGRGGRRACRGRQRWRAGGPANAGVAANADTSADGVAASVDGRGRRAGGPANAGVAASAGGRGRRAGGRGRRAGGAANAGVAANAGGAANVDDPTSVDASADGGGGRRAGGAANAGGAASVDDPTSADGGGGRRVDGAANAGGTANAEADILKKVCGYHRRMFIVLAGKIQDLEYEQKSLLRDLDVKQNGIEDAFDEQLKNLRGQLAIEKSLINNDRTTLKEKFKRQIDAIYAEKIPHRTAAGKLQNLNDEHHRLLHGLDIIQRRIEDTLDEQLKNLRGQLAIEKSLINDDRKTLKKEFKRQIDAINAEKIPHVKAVDKITKIAGPINSYCDLSGMAPAEREALYQKANQICSERESARDAPSNLTKIIKSMIEFNEVPDVGAKLVAEPGSWWCRRARKRAAAARSDSVKRQLKLRTAFQSLDLYKKTITSRESKSNDFDAKYDLYKKTMEELRNNESLVIDDDLRAKMISEKRYFQIKFLREKRYKMQNRILAGKMNHVEGSFEEFKNISCLNSILSRCDSLDIYAQKYSKERLLKYIADVRGQVSMIREQLERLETPKSEEELEQMIAETAKIKFEQDQYMCLDNSTLCHDMLTP